MRIKQRNLIVVITFFIALLVAMLVVVTLLSPSSESSQNDTVQTDNPVLSVVTITPRLMTLPGHIFASGNIMAWQEASIGNQVNGLKLAEVLVDVGDVVKRDQLLAYFVTESVNAELAQSRASVEEAKALLAEAQADADRARELQSSKAMSAQQVQQYLTAEKSAFARLQLARATEATRQVQVAQTQLRAPDDGVISSRTANVGAVPATGDELFRLIRQSKLEWRAEVAASDLGMLKSGHPATITLSEGNSVKGKLRMISPVVDMESLNGLVYVDLPQNNELRAGMYAQGKFEVNASQALTLPASAVLLRDGFSYVFCVNSDSRIEQTKVTLGRRSGSYIEILKGIDSLTRVVKSGGGFLGDGDLVRIVEDKSSDNTLALKREI